MSRMQLITHFDSPLDNITGRGGHDSDPTATRDDGCALILDRLIQLFLDTETVLWSFELKI